MQTRCHGRGGVPQPCPPCSAQLPHLTSRSLFHLNRLQVSDTSIDGIHLCSYSLRNDTTREVLSDRCSQREEIGRSVQDCFLLTSSIPIISGTSKEGAAPEASAEMSVGQPASLVKAQLAKAISRKPSLLAAASMSGRLNRVLAEQGNASVDSMEDAPCLQARPRLASDIKNAGKLLQQLSTRLEAAGFYSKTSSRRASMAVTDDMAAPV